MTKAYLGTVVLTLIFGLAARSEPKASADRPYEIAIGNFSFGPRTLTIPAGAAVTWVNHDDTPHIVASKDGKDFKSPVLDTDQKFTHSFSRPGTYDYYCTVHPMMTGRIVVK